MIRRIVLLAALATAAIACSTSTGTQGTGASSQALTQGKVEGKFAQYLVSPRGDIDGALLQDGTVARFPPHALVANAPTLQPGDAVTVQGTTGPEARTLSGATLTKGDVVIANAAAAPPPPPGPRGPRGAGPGRGPRPGMPGPRGPREEGLTDMTVTGTVKAWLTDPRGRVDGVVLDDGTTARAGRKARLDALGLAIGAKVTLRGRGGSYPQGKSLHIESITLPNGEQRTIERPRTELAPVTRDGTVARVLLNPRGDVDGVLLADGGVVRFPPTAARLDAAAKIHAEGRGTSVFVDATSLTVNGAPLDLTPPPPPAAPPAPLGAVTTSSPIKSFVDTPDGDHDAALLADGSIVKLPPALRDDAADALQVGTSITASGEGGTYGGVKAFRASRVTVASGKTFADDAPPAPPPPVSP